MTKNSYTRFLNVTYWYHSLRCRVVIMSTLLTSLLNQPNSNWKIYGTWSKLVWLCIAPQPLKLLGKVWCSSRTISWFHAFTPHPCHFDLKFLASWLQTLTVSHIESSLSRAHTPCSCVISLHNSPLQTSQSLLLNSIFSIDGRYSERARVWRQEGERLR